MYQKPKGTRDILPDVSYKWQYMESAFKNLAKVYGYKEIRTPMFEDTNLYLRSVGESSDIVSKEMYTFLDKGQRSLTLRPEGTAGVVRAFVENGLFSDVLPQKMFYIGSNFRYENPQAGRYREHAQFGAESFGIDTPLGELESIDLAVNMLKSIGIKNVELHINSIGCPTCRKQFNDALKDFAFKNKQDLCQDCQRRMQTNPMRMLDCKVESCRNILTNAPKLQDYLCEACKNHFKEVQKLLKQNKINYVVDENLVRGFDYYTKTVFEFVCKNIDQNGKTLSVGGGGRYDNLVEEVGGKPTSCVGFGLGLDRLLMILPEVDKPKTDIYVLNVGDVDMQKVYELTTFFRQNGLVAECNLCEKSFKSQFKYAQKLGARYICLVGEQELNTNTLTLKDDQSGEEQKVSKEKILEILK